MLYYAFAALLALAAGTFLVLLLRQGRPRDATGWAGVVLSIALLCTSAAVVLLARALTRPAPLALEEFGQAVPQVGQDAVGKPAPDLPFRLLAGDREASLGALRGRVVLVNFWATWCGPCLEELPILERLQQDYGPLGLQVVALSDEPPEVLRDFDALPPSVAVAYLEPGEPVADVYRHGIAFRPVSYVIDREGTLHYVEVGARSYSFFEGIVQDLLQPGIAMR